jgi:hypothetical protein
MVSEISCRNEAGTKQKKSYLINVEYDVAERLCPSFRDLGDDILVSLNGAGGIRTKIGLYATERIEFPSTAFIYERNIVDAPAWLTGKHAPIIERNRISRPRLDVGIVIL